MDASELSLAIVASTWHAKICNALLDGADPGLSTSRYAKLTQCSLDTALRDIKALRDAGILVSGPGGGRSTKYHLNSPPAT